METHLVAVIDGPNPPPLAQSADAEPQLLTEPQHLPVLLELLQLEPIFHRRSCGTTRQDFEKRTAPTFWEVGASGRRYSRRYALDMLEEKYKKPTEHIWEIKGFHCQEIAPDNFLVTYTLFQGERVSRRSTIWRRTAEGWQIVFDEIVPRRGG